MTFVLWTSRRIFLLEAAVVEPADIAPNIASVLPCDLRIKAGETVSMKKKDSDLSAIKS